MIPIKKRIEERERWKNSLKQRYPFLLDQISYIEIEEGWQAIIEELIESIHRREYYLKINGQPENYVETQLNQIKQKFASLRVYYIGGNEEGIYSLVRRAEDLAEKTCEFCGGTDKTVHAQSIRSWFFVLCKECADNHRNWNPVKNE
jgi:hypothetical protein